MLPTLGYLTLALAFLLALYGLVASIWGIVEKSPAWTQSARLALPVIFLLVTISVGVMIFLLLDHRFDVAYVYSVTSRSMPAYLRITALWGGQTGSLLFWSWLLSAFAMGFVLRRWSDEQDMLPWVLVVMCFSLVFFLILNVFIENPFERFWHMADGSRLLATFQPSGAWPLMPRNGQGLNPLLRHPGMILHPPALYLGFVGFLIPFAAGIASLAAGRQDARWMTITRRWTLLAWVFLTLGLVLGMRWAYDVLGWGGYWGWDPVEIAALLPWLSATAFLHSILLQARHEGFKRWNLILNFLTFGLVIFGTFLTRSGVLSSVHSFARSAVGPLFFGFIALTSIGALGLLVYRWQKLQGTHALAFRFSRETLTLFTNFVLLNILAVCFLGMMYPLISELLTDTQVTVGPVWYERITGPLFLVLLLLMGLCPLAGWGGASLVRLKKRLIILIPLSLLGLLAAWLSGVDSFLALAAIWLVSFTGLVLLGQYIQQVAASLRNKNVPFLKALWRPVRRQVRRYGGLQVHFGIVLIGLGIIGIEGLQQQTQVTLALGEGVDLGGYRFTFEGLESGNMDDGRAVTRTVLAVSQDGEPAGALYPRRDFFPDWQQTYTHPGLRSNLAVDLYAILVDWRPVTQDQATFKIFVNPLVNWMWIGTGVLTLGTVMAAWPERKKDEE
jgi:cytochrome c-type biogenesis protein CcmF